MVAHERPFLENFVTCHLIKENDYPKYSFKLHLCCFFGGKIVHFTFFIPLTINNESTCNFNQGSFYAKLLMET